MTQMQISLITIKTSQNSFINQTVLHINLINFIVFYISMINNMLIMLTRTMYLSMNKKNIKHTRMHITEHII